MTAASHGSNRQRQPSYPHQKEDVAATPRSRSDLLDRWRLDYRRQTSRLRPRPRRWLLPQGDGQPDDRADPPEIHLSRPTLWRPIASVRATLVTGADPTPNSQLASIASSFSPLQNPTTTIERRSLTATILASHPGVVPVVCFGDGTIRLSMKGWRRLVTRPPSFLLERPN
jgi:hypothetical protein